MRQEKRWGREREEVKTDGQKERTKQAGEKSVKTSSRFYPLSCPTSPPVLALGKFQQFGDLWERQLIPVLLLSQYNLPLPPSPLPPNTADPSMT